MSKFHTQCTDSDCPNKESCLRFTPYKHTHPTVDAKICKHYEFCFRIEKDGGESERVARDNKYRAWENNPFTYSMEHKAEICHFCNESSTEHKLIDRGLNKEEQAHFGPGEAWFPFHRHMRECTGCKRTDGPWVPGYD